MHAYSGEGENPTYKHRETTPGNAIQSQAAAPGSSGATWPFDGLCMAIPFLHIGEAICAHQDMLKRGLEGSISTGVAACSLLINIVVCRTCPPANDDGPQGERRAQQ